VHVGLVDRFDGLVVSSLSDAAVLHPGLFVAAGRGQDELRAVGN